MLNSRDFIFYNYTWHYVPQMSIHLKNPEQIKTLEKPMELKLFSSLLLSNINYMGIGETGSSWKHIFIYKVLKKKMQLKYNY